MGAKRCPVCDGKVTKRNYCKTCKRFVTPNETSQEFYLNESREWNASQDLKASRGWNASQDLNANQGWNGNQERSDAEPIMQNPTWSWQPENTNFRTYEDRKKKNGVAIFLIAFFCILIIAVVIIGLCVGFLRGREDDSDDMSNEYDVENYLKNEIETEAETESPERGTSDYDTPDGYTYSMEPGETGTGLYGEFTAISAEDAKADGKECTLIGHYDGVTVDEFTDRLLEYAKEEGVNLKPEEYYNRLSLYRYDDGETYYERINSYSANIGTVGIYVYSDYNTGRLHSFCIWQAMKGNGDYYRMDEVFEAFVKALDDTSLSVDSHDSILENLHTFRDKPYSEEETDSNSTELYVGNWYIAISRENGYVYMDVFID